LDLNGPEAGLEAELPGEAIDRFEDAALNVVGLCVHFVQKLIGANVVQGPK